MDRGQELGEAEGIRVVALYRYPVKGFSAEPLTRADLPTGGTFPFDRAFAIENGPSGFDPAAPNYLPKSRFLMLMRNERMAEYRTRLDEATGTFAISRDGTLEIEASLTDEAGRRALEDWISVHFRDELRAPPRILSAPGHSFSDLKAKVVHIVNLASVRALEAEIGAKVDPVRFRPNIVVDGAPAWSEFDWIGAPITIGEVSLRGVKRTTRCAATNVDPATGHRDMQIPRSLDELYAHSDFGIYASVEAGGVLSIGDPVAPLLQEGLF